MEIVYFSTYASMEDHNTWPSHFVLQYSKPYGSTYIYAFKAFRSWAFLCLKVASLFILGNWWQKSWFSYQLYLIKSLYLALLLVQCHDYLPWYMEVKACMSYHSHELINWFTAFERGQLGKGKKQLIFFWQFFRFFFLINWFINKCSKSTC